MLHSLFKFLAGISLALCLLCVFVWVRSTSTDDCMFWQSGRHGYHYIASHRHALHWLSNAATIHDDPGWPVIVTFAGNIDAADNDNLPGLPLRHAGLGVWWADRYDDESETSTDPFERVRVRVVVVPFALFVAVAAILPSAYLIFARRKTAGTKSRRANCCNVRRLVVATSLLICGVTIFLWIRSIALDFHRISFHADRYYDLVCPLHLSAFQVHIQDNPFDYQLGPKRSWQIVNDGWWMPFGTYESAIGWCVAPDPAKRFPGFHYERVDKQVTKEGGVLFDDPHVEQPTAMMTTRTITVPYWFVAIATAAYPLIRARQLITLIRGNSRARRGLCRKCGYDIRATPQRCPECGIAVIAPMNGHDSGTKFPIGPEVMPHRKNAAEWIMFGVLFPIAWIVRQWGRLVRRGGRA